VLLAPGAHPVMANTTVPAVLAAEALVTALMISRRANVERAARLTEAIAGYLHDPRAGRGRA
jgi:metal-dependent amidase/aminoacylase/carboxypeptidase family protein